MHTLLQIVCRHNAVFKYPKLVDENMDKFLINYTPSIGFTKMDYLENKLFDPLEL